MCAETWGLAKNILLGKEDGVGDQNSVHDEKKKLFRDAPFQELSAR